MSISPSSFDEAMLVEATEWTGPQRLWLRVLMKLGCISILRIQGYVLRIRDYTDQIIVFEDGIGTRKNSTRIGMGLDS